jgi:hypothetical protein
MKPIQLRTIYLRWLSFSLVCLSVLAAAPAWAGKTSAGGASGVTTGGSASGTSGGAPITGDNTRPSSENVAIDPETGTLILTPGAQASLNQSAQQVLQQVGANNPSLISALSQPLAIVPDEQIDNLGLAIRGINEGEPLPKATLREAAMDASEQAIGQFRWAELYIDQEVLDITAPLVVLGSEDQYFITAVYTSPGEAGTTSSIVLRGSLEDLGNAAAFLVITAGSGIDPAAIAPFANMAAAGAPYPELLDLLIAVNGLVIADAAGEDIDPDELNRAIHAYRAIVNSVDQPTRNALGNNADFMALKQALENLRTSVET